MEGLAGRKILIQQNYRKSKHHEQRLAEGEKSPGGDFLLQHEAALQKGRAKKLPADSKIINHDEECLMNRGNSLELDRPLRFLSPKEIGMIDEFLATLNVQGELRLVVHKGKLRFVTRTKDYEVKNNGYEKEAGSV